MQQGLPASISWKSFVLVRQTLCFFKCRADRAWAVHPGWAATLRTDAAGHAGQDALARPPARAQGGAALTSDAEAKERI